MNFSARDKQVSRSLVSYLARRTTGVEHRSQRTHPLLTLFIPPTFAHSSPALDLTPRALKGMAPRRRRSLFSGSVVALSFVSYALNHSVHSVHADHCLTTGAAGGRASSLSCVCVSLSFSTLSPNLFLHSIGIFARQSCRLALRASKLDLSAAPRSPTCSSRTFATL